MYVATKRGREGCLMPSAKISLRANIKRERIAVKYTLTVSVSKRKRVKGGLLLLAFCQLCVEWRSFKENIDKRHI